MVDKQKQLSHIPAVRQVKLYKTIENRANTLTPAQKRVFDYLLRYFDRYGTHQVSQIRIAHDLRLSRQTVNESIARLAKFKFIGKITRYKKTCIYNLHKFFQNYENRRRLIHVFSEARSFLNPILLRSRKLYSENGKGLKNNPTLISYYNYKVTSSSSSLFNINIDRSRRSSCHTTKQVTRAHTYAYEEPKKGQSSMSEIVKALITPTIREITELLTLTKWGQLKLTVFPDEILKFGIQELKRAKRVKDPFQWLVSHLRDYCKTQEIEMKWEQYYFLKESLKQPENASMAFESPTRQQDPKKNSISTVPDSVRFARPDIRTKVPEEDPQDRIRWWKAWMADPIFPKARLIAGRVPPHILGDIVEGKIPQHQLDELYAEYDFLKPCVEEFRAKREANPSENMYSNPLMTNIQKVVSGI